MTIMGGYKSLPPEKGLMPAQTLQLPRCEVEAGYPLTWRFRVPPAGTERCTLLRAVLKVYAWKFRQRSAGGHTHTNPDTGSAAPPAAVAEAEVANANLDIKIDGVSYKTGLGDGTEKKVLEEDITDKIKSPKEHTVEFSMSTSRSGIEGILELEW